MRLERIATALYVTRQSGEDVVVEDRAARLTALKPHVDLEDALSAVRESDTLLARHSV